MDSRNQTTPENHQELVSRSLVLYRLTFFRTWFYALLMAITIFIPRLLSDMIGQDIFKNQDTFSLHRLWLIFIPMFALLFFISIIWNMHCHVMGKHEPMLEDINKGAKKIFSVLFAGFILAALLFCFSYAGASILILSSQIEVLVHLPAVGMVIISILAFLLIGFLFYIAVLFIFVIPLIAIENKGLFQAMNGSGGLVWKNWWRVFSTQITPWIFYLLALVVIRYLLHFNIHMYFTEAKSHNIAVTILNLVCFALFVPWIGALLVTQLKDLELRKQIAKSNTTKN